MGKCKGLHERHTPRTDSWRCLLQELARDNIEGCTTYSVSDTHALVCEEFTMRPGDVLYMPKGVVHYALTADDSESYHLTIGLHRDNMQWRDVVRYLIDAKLFSPVTRPRLFCLYPVPEFPAGTDLW